MNLASKKYFKTVSLIVLAVNISFLAAASFHSHHIEYSSFSRISNTLPNGEYAEPAVCLFNQLNKPAYFYFNNDYSSFNSFSTEVITIIPSINSFHSQELYFLSNLRAPPAVI